MMASHMPVVYRQWRIRTMLPAPCSRDTWSLLALTCQFELFVHSHYAESNCAARGPLPALPGRVPVSRRTVPHVRFDELEWKAEHQMLSGPRRARSGGERSHHPRGRRLRPPAYASRVGRRLFPVEASNSYFSTERTTKTVPHIERSLLGAYRWQYIISGVRHRISSVASHT